MTQLFRKQRRTVDYLRGMVALCGRVLLGWFFASQALQRIDEWSSMVILVQMKRVPFGQVSLGLSLIAMFFGSAGLVMGFQTRFSAFVLAICTSGWVLIAHDFWTIQDPVARQSDFLTFSLGVAVIGGLLCLFASGGGQFSVDRLSEKHQPN